MGTYILLFRGVMPTGKNKLPMAQLREVLTSAGFKNVRTYIQSGNALVNSELSLEELAITKDAGYMYITGTYGRGILSGNFLEKKLGISATMRNFNTISKLIELSK